MVSRVEKYHDKALDDNRRVVKNKDLYDNIYQEAEAYSNIEGVVETNTTNEIDLAKVKELINKQKVEERRLVKKELEIPNISIDDDDEGNYDIRDVLAHAKEESKVDNKPRKLDDFDFEGIKNRLNNIEKYTEEEQKKDIEDLKELIETIAGNNTSLNGLADKELSLDMFPDLKKTTEMSANNDAIKKVIADSKKATDEENTLSKELEIDKSFYTGTMNIKNRDFTDDGEDEKIHVPLFVKIFLIVIAIVVLIAFVIVGYDILKGVIL